MARRRTALTVGLIVGVIVVVSVGYWAGRSLHASNVSDLRAAVYGQCHRQNVGRITGNRNNYSQYRLWSAAITLLTYDAAQPPEPGKAANPQGTALFQAFLGSMTQLLHSESWTPLSNCQEATDHPVSYVPPAAVPFSKQPPPLSAFTLGPNE